MLFRSIAAYLENPYEVAEKTIGIVAPVHCLAMPPIVEEFLKKIDMLPEYCFYIATMGVMDGQTLGQAKDILSERDLRLNYATKIALPDNSIVFATPAARKDALLRNADAEISLISRNIRNNHDNYNKIKRNKLWQYGGTATGWLVLKNLISIGKVNSTDACNGCKLCQTVCPTKNVEIKNSKAEFGDKCEHCFACAHWCPLHAVKLGYLKVNDKTQYTHPAIKASEMSLQKERNAKI